MPEQTWFITVRPTGYGFEVTRSIPVVPAAPAETSPAAEQITDLIDAALAEYLSR